MSRVLWQLNQTRKGKFAAVLCSVIRSRPKLGCERLARERADRAGGRPDLPRKRHATRQIFLGLPREQLDLPVLRRRDVRSCHEVVAGHGKGKARRSVTRSLVRFAPRAEDPRCSPCPRDRPRATLRSRERWLRRRGRRLVCRGGRPRPQEPPLDGSLADCGSFADCFGKAIESLTGTDDPKHGYHRNLAPIGLLSDQAARTLDACQASWVFGGMGSWNDLGFDGEDQRLYERGSERLFRAINAAIAAATNTACVAHA
jgi:hypothetical protein